MKVDRISYQKLFPLGVYTNERIGMEAQLQDGDVYEDCFAELKKEVEAFHKSTNQQLYQDSDSPVASFQKPDSKESATERMLTAINTCTEMKVLETFKLLVKNNQVFQEAYDNKLKSFQ